MFLIFSATVVAAKADDWSYYQHDAAHTGDSSVTLAPNAMSLSWSAPAGYSTPLVVGNTVYATENGQGTGNPTMISSFALSNGAINWTYSGSFVFPSQAAVGGGFVVFQGIPSPAGSASSLYVLDANTGALRYTVPIPESYTTVMPTVVQDSTTGVTTAYVADGSNVTSVTLGSSSGAVNWTSTGSFGGFSIPTVVGNSVVVAGPGQYYAIDRTTGASNHFHAGDISGGGGTTVAFDAARNQFYVREDYSGSMGTTLSAYHYTDNGHIQLLWQRTGAGIGNVGSVAIGPNGNLYSAGSGVIWELDPTTGNTLRSISGSFAGGATPALTNGVLWVYTNSQVVAYDLATLQLLRGFTDSRGSSNSPYDSPGAFTDNRALLDYGNIAGYPGFDVYAQIPEPATMSFLTLGLGGLVIFGARRQLKTKLRVPQKSERWSGSYGGSEKGQA